MKDIFTDMQAKIGCMYLSDLPYHKRVVWYELKRLPLAVYDTKQLEDFSRYVFVMSEVGLRQKDMAKQLDVSR